MRDDEQYLQALKDIYKKHFRHITTKEEYCQFRDKTGEKYCKATSHKNCKRCKMFTPTIQTMIRIMVINSEELILEIEAKKAIIKDIRNEIDRLHEIIRLKNERLQRLEDDRKRAEQEKIRNEKGTRSVR